MVLTDRTSQGLATCRHWGNRWVGAFVPVALIVAGVVLAAGCGGGGGGGAVGVGGGRSDAALAASPVVLGGENGLEVQYWVATGEGDAMHRAFGEFGAGAGAGGGTAGGSPVDENSRALLEQNGLRVFVVPIDRLGEVQSRLNVIGAVQRQWLGQAPSWVDIATGPLRPVGQTIALHDGALRVGPGRLRMLMRGWTVPVPGLGGKASGASGAAIDVEFVPQHQETGRRGELALSPTRLAPEDEGLVFTRLLARMRLRGDVAVVIVPERPGARWEARAPEPEPPANVAGPSPDAGAAAAAPGIGQVSRVEAGVRAANSAAAAAPTSGAFGEIGAQEQGPPTAALPSLGEAMLMSRADLPGADGTVPGSAVSKTVRAVVVLVPRVPERFQLLGR